MSPTFALATSSPACMSPAFAPDLTVRRAVLVGSRPADDLNDLLSRQGIAVIWPDGQRFTDDAGGEFT
jgi:hypothetical protein